VQARTSRNSSLCGGGRRWPQGAMSREMHGVCLGVTGLEHSTRIIHS